jgi:hypothetical protein
MRWCAGLALFVFHFNCAVGYTLGCIWIKSDPDVVIGVCAGSARAVSMQLVVSFPECLK